MLSDQEEAFVKARIERSTISSRALGEDLLDHFCCLIEEQMDQGRSFEEAYQVAWQRICPNGLGEIQRETTFLRNATKIMLMKKLLYTVGLLSSISISAGWLFKLLHLQGGGALFTYGFLALVFLFLPLLALDRYKLVLSSGPAEKLKVLLGFTSALATGLAVLFKLMHLQGAGMLLVLGAFLFALGFLPLLFLGLYKKSFR